MNSHWKTYILLVQALPWSDVASWSSINTYLGSVTFSPKSACVWAISIVKLCIFFDHVVGYVYIHTFVSRLASSLSLSLFITFMNEIVGKDKSIRTRGQLVGAWSQIICNASREKKIYPKKGKIKVSNPKLFYNRSKLSVLCLFAS